MSRIAKLREGSEDVVDCLKCKRAFLIVPNDFGSALDCPYCGATHITPKRNGSIPTKTEIGLKTLEEIGRVVQELDD